MLEDASAPDLTTDDLAMPDLAEPPDLTTPPMDMAIKPVAPCSWRDRFAEVYGHAWNKGDVAFVTTDNAVSRGMDKLNFAAQKTQVPDIVLVNGNSNRIKEIRLLEPSGTKVLASKSGAHIYGLGYSMWLEVNGYGESGITEMTLIRQLSQETASYQQLVGLYRVLTKTSESQVPVADRSDYQQQMGHVWLGFSEPQIRRWCDGAGFSDVRFDALPTEATAKGPALFRAVAMK